LCRCPQIFASPLRHAPSLSLSRLLSSSNGRFGVHSAVDLSLLSYLSPGATITPARQTAIENVAGIVFQTGLTGFTKASLHERLIMITAHMVNISRRCFRVMFAFREMETADTRRCTQIFASPSGALPHSSPSRLLSPQWALWSALRHIIITFSIIKPRRAAIYIRATDQN